MTINDANNYIPNKCYFKVAYYDYDLRYPKVETVIYLGNAFELKDRLPTQEAYLYFQDAESFSNHGFLNSQGHKLDEGEMGIFQFTEANAKKFVYDIDGMINELMRWNKTCSY
ncbi:hypothetical protein MCAMS1_01052 [biofilm metagenome]